MICGSIRISTLGSCDVCETSTTGIGDSLSPYKAMPSGDEFEKLKAISCLLAQYAHAVEYG
eukprot:22542-Amphidinium_carterae.1